MADGGKPSDDPKAKDKDPDPGKPKDPTDDDGDLAHWKREARKWEARAKSNSDAATKLQELEDKGKSEIELLTEKVKTAEARAATFEKDLRRLAVGMRKGLSEAQVKRLIGETEEDLEKDADELIATFSTKKDDKGDDKKTDDTKKTTDRTPRERLRSGAQPTEEPEPDPTKIADAVLNSRAF